jgi:UDP-3-O-[3-hydroxymyristoyl] glucosamine N-acyltransferase
VSFSVLELLGWIQGRVVNSEELGEQQIADVRVSRPTSLGCAMPTDLAFFFSRAFEHELATARPGVLITGEAFVKPLRAAQLPLWGASVVIACEDPYWAMAVISEKFAASSKTTSGRQAQVHPSAVLHPSVVLAEGVQIGAYCVIREGVMIGARSVVEEGCVLGAGCQVGEDTVLFPRVCVYSGVVIGSRVRLHSGVVVGADGFGYAPKRDGQGGVEHVKIHHLGKVVIEDDVEIGANSCVDRGTFGETRIGRGSKLDNLVQVGHNARVGRGCLLCGAACLAGNAVLGEFVTVGGAAGVANQVHVGDGARVGAMTLVTKDVEKGGTAVGNPQRDHRTHFKVHALLNKLLAERSSK